MTTNGKEILNGANFRRLATDDLLAETLVGQMNPLILLFRIASEAFKKLFRDSQGRVINNDQINEIKLLNVMFETLY